MKFFIGVMVFIRTTYANELRYPAIGKIWTLMTQTASLLFVLLISELHSIVWAQSIDRHELQVAPHIKTGDLSSAIFSNPVVGDFNGDGELDLIVATQHFGKGVRFYRGDFSEGNRVFAPGVDVALPVVPMTGINLNQDPLTDILLLQDHGGESPRTVLAFALCQGGSPPRFEKPVILRRPKSTETLASAKFLSARSTRESIDIVTGGFDFQDYWPVANDPRDAAIGFWTGYDITGRWKGREQLQFLTLFQLLNVSPPAMSSGRLMTGQLTPLAARLGVSPIIIDADGDGLDDIIYSDFVGNLFIAKKQQNAAVATYEDPVPLYLKNGKRAQAPQCVVRGQAVHWNSDHREDLVFGCEDGFVYVSLNNGTQSANLAFHPPFRIQQKRPPLDFGVAAVPTPCDVDDDGDTDLIVGNASGEILIATNQGSNKHPVFGMPIQCEVEEKPFRIEAGYGGSVQGPAEARWGYVSVSTSDIDDDGDTDLLYSSVNGYHQSLVNIGDSREPKWTHGPHVSSKGKRYRSVWRTRPLQLDWDDDGILDYICLNRKGQVGIFPGAPNRAWNHLDDWIAWRFEGGDGIDPDSDNGMEGRAKIAIADWDQDGLRDLLIGTKGGTPWASRYGHKNRSYVFFLKGIQNDRSAVFAAPKAIRFANGTDIDVGDHTAAPETVTFFGDKKPGLLLGIENGRIHYYSQHELSW